MSERCYKCGRIKCETCGGTGYDGETLTDTGYGPLRFPCPDCEDGWQKAEVHRGRYGTRFSFLCKPIRGEDSSVLCPGCRCHQRWWRRLWRWLGGWFAGRRTDASQQS